MISCHCDVTKVVVLGIEYRYRSLSSIKVSSIDVIAGIVLTLLETEWDDSDVVDGQQKKISKVNEKRKKGKK